MYIALWHCRIERKLSVHFLPNLMSKNNIIGKPEATAQAAGTLQAGSTQASVAKAMQIIFSPVKGWWKKRLSQKYLVDEKRSGRPSILRKVQKNFISKSLHKRGWSTRKLASKLTIRGLQCFKDTIHIYLRFDLWSLFMQEACFTQNLQKSDCI
jgi:hypothetical protein